MSGDRRDQPYGNTAKFVGEILASGGSAFVDSWLVGGLNCAFTFDTIYTTGLGHERILGRYYELAYEHGVKVRKCNKVRDAFYDEMDRRENKKRGAPRTSPEPPSMIPGQRQRDFRAAVESRLRPGFFEAIFDPSQIRYAGDSVMLVRAPITERVLKRDGGDLLKEYGLTVRFCGQTFLGEPDTTRDATDEERAHVGQMLRDLAKSLRSDPNSKPVPQTLAQRVAARAKP